MNRATRSAVEEPAHEDAPLQSGWQWFALGVLVFCWIAEASMCAQRGF